MSSKRKRKAMAEEENESSGDRPDCVFCGQNLKNKYFMGKMMVRNGMSAHYYCILFSPGLQQNGGLDEDFKGFLAADMKKEVRRASKLSCTYCHRRGAVIGCCDTSCAVKFHLTCGLVHNSFHAFHDPLKSYPSYCEKHRPKQKTRRVNQKAVDRMCAICREEVTPPQPSPKTLWTPCCGHWMHRECVIKQAYHAGKHHLKCPNCNNRDEFVTEMKAFGVHVPSRDASWEKGSTFQDLYDHRYECSVEKCLSRKGKDFNGDKEWEILACDGCGANATHIKCSALEVDTEEWMCSLCKPILSNDKKLKTINQ
ncbi:unnamed protein product [Oppiella nova]|uniref:PHD finger protein 7 n=1 Tax=Oppiella nova TaxID=334625 RepID=A0A7R9LWK6_9ACAR|nr:unnamed protein product [Oppiella nova]CAG2167013.1 unnamed protein product [Oppiella nova]